MLFATFDYFLFLPVVAVVHWMLPAQPGTGTARTSWILLVSLIFYAAWNPADTALLLVIVAMAWVFGLLLRGLSERGRSALIALAALCLLGPMVFFKYTHWAMESLAHFVPVVVPERHHLPIGISFYSFQALAYVIDVRRTLGARARGEVPKHPLEVETNPVRFATFLLFFPHLVAGPILRAGTLLTQLMAERKLDPEDVSYAVTRLGTGLVKKVLIADVLRIGIIDSVFADPTRFGALEVLIALYAYSLQIYCDFSGYTDFAIGSARLFGFKIPENFNRPLPRVVGRGLLAALAHHLVGLGARLRVLPAGRVAGAPLPQHVHHAGDPRGLAWCKLDFCALRLVARHRGQHQSLLEALGLVSRLAHRAPSRVALGVDLPFCRPRAHPVPVARHRCRRSDRRAALAWQLGVPTVFASRVGRARAWVSAARLSACVDGAVARGFCGAPGSGAGRCAHRRGLAVRAVRPGRHARVHLP